MKEIALQFPVIVKAAENMKKEEKKKVRRRVDG